MIIAISISSYYIEKYACDLFIYDIGSIIACAIQALKYCHLFVPFSCRSRRRHLLLEDRLLHVHPLQG